MKKLIAIMALAFGFSGQVYAADIYGGSYKDAPIITGSPFDGFNVFVQGGYAWTQEEKFQASIPNVKAEQSGITANGGFGGVGVGYGRVFGNVYAGITTDINFGDISGNSTGATVSITTPAVPASRNHPAVPAKTVVSSFPSHANLSIDWFGATRAKLGYVFGNNFMLYGNAGLAYAGGSADVSEDPFASLSGNDTVTGWTVGGGFEYMVGPKLSIAIEFDHYEFDNFSIDGKIDGHVVQVKDIDPSFDAVMCKAVLHF